MAWARPPGAPELPSTPLEALEPRENEYTSIIDKYALPVGLGLTGLLAPIGTNFYFRRPLYTAIWKNILGGISMTYFGLFLRNIRDEMAVDRDEVLRQYISLHPEDFPPYEKKLYRDVFEPWVPHR